MCRHSQNCFNSPKADGDLAGIKIVAGYLSGTDMPASRDRVAKFTEQVRGMGVMPWHGVKHCHRAGGSFYKLTS